MNIQLMTKPVFDVRCQRIEAWFHQEITDRAPIRFHRHNAEYEEMIRISSPHASLRNRQQECEQRNPN